MTKASDTPTEKSGNSGNTESTEGAESAGTADKIGKAEKVGARGGSRRFRLRQRMSMHIYVLPNLLTTANIFFGFLAIIQAIKGEYQFAAYAIVAAAVFDQLDGRVARLTHSTSQFGAEYDSLCDLVSFGVAPALLLYLWALHPFGRIGWVISFLFAACGALRLARFNVQKNIIEKSYFQGLPIPMAAGIVASSVLFYTDLQIDPIGSWLLLSMAALLAFVMVSNFRYRSFKDIDLKQRLPFHYLVGAVLLLTIVVLRHEVMIFVVFLSYAVLGAVFGFLRLGKPARVARPPIAAIESGDDLFEAVWDEDNEASKETSK